jgi:phosphoribosylformimino-5-aminoimidazole carboxamide ribonucleotide (ProFAR) isomerase
MTGVELYPAIDLRDGKAVRLVRGDYDAETIYDDDPVAVAAGFAADGVRWLHVVDLDAARTGEPVNRPIVGAIASAVGVHGVRVQSGGAVGLDGRQGMAAVHGWLDETAVSVLDALSRFEDAGVDAVIVTEITRDGTLEGPDVEGLRSVLERTTIPVIASGGVGSLEDLEALAGLEWGGRYLTGVIVGTALYEHRFRVAKAMSVLGSV